MRTLRLLNALPLLAAIALTARPAAAQDWDDAGTDWVRRCERWNGGDDREQVCEERVVRIAAPRTLEVDGRQNGGVSVRAWDGSGVEIRERIQAWAPTRDEARGVAREIRVHTDGGRIYADGPDAGRRRGYSVSYVIMVPRRTDLRLDTHNGPVSVNGVSGRMELSAVNGPVSLHEVGGDGRARVQNGPLTVALAGQRWSGAGLDAETTNGPVTLSLPRGYAARLTTGTVHGPMEINIPVTVQGRFPRQFTTDIGGGGPPVRVVTTNGPVEVGRR
jgi:hypothetical protein